ADCASVPFTATVQVIQTPIPDFSIDANVCQDEVYEISYTGQSEATTLYDWNFADGQVVSGSGAGPIYVRFPFAGPRTVSVTANNLGCDATVSRNITVHPKPVVDAGEATFMCENAYGAALSPSIQPDVPGCMFFWSPGTGLDNPNSRNPTAFISQTTTYSLIAVCNGCSSLVDSVTVYVRSRPSVILEDYSVGYCLGQGGAQIHAIATGGTGPLAYHWYAVPNTQAPAVGLSDIHSPSPVASPTTPQYYKLVVTDSMGCQSDTATVFVDVYPVPRADAGQDVFLCHDAPGVFLNGSGFFPGNNGFGSFSFRWRPAVGLSDTTIANPFATPEQTTIYTLVVTDDYGCSSLPSTTDELATVVVTRAPRPLANAGPDKYLCYDAPEGVQIGDVPSGGELDEYQYYWTPSVGFNPLSDTAVMRPVVKPDYTVTYFLKAKYAGCESIADTVTVFVVPRPTAAVDVAVLEVCPGQSVQIRGIGGGNVNGETIEYRWRPAAGLSDSTAQNPLASPDTTTVYTLYTYIRGCETQTPATALVQVLPQPTVDADPLDLPRYICAGDTVQLPGFVQSPAQPVYIRWEPPTRLSNSQIVNPLAFPLETTTYTLFASYGPCTVKDSITVRVGPPIPVSIEADTNVICGGQGTYLRASGGIGSGTFVWSPTTGLNPDTGATVFASPSQTTMYTLMLREAGCIGIDSVLVEVVPSPVTRYTHSFPGGCNRLTVSFTDQSQNVVGWEWNFGDGTISNQPSPVHTYRTPGTYTVSLRTRSTGECYQDSTFASTITVSPGLSAAFLVYPANTDTFSWPAPEFEFVDASTGGPISWFWDFGDGMSALGSSVRHRYFFPGSFTVTLVVSDHMGCIDTASAKIVIVEPTVQIPNIFTPNADGV
ncbi:MAG: PKD domain-containing protein, partial [Bacteroidia bacterium]|nr:PKD domain-containing protein [Bacteroidia bacterium]